jgi:cytosine/adenosine deaminase-related metal-dependent hydrolase
VSKSVLKKHRAFLKAFIETHSIGDAAKAAGIDRSTHYDWLETVPGYRQAWEATKEEATQTLEDEASRRALKGVTEGVYYKGKPIGVKRTYSDAMMMFLLRAARPEKYRTGVELTGPNGGPLEAGLTVTFVTPPKKEDE